MLRRRQAVPPPSSSSSQRQTASSLSRSPSPPPTRMRQSAAASTSGSQPQPTPQTRKRTSGATSSPRYHDAKAEMEEPPSEHRPLLDDRSSTDGDARSSVSASATTWAGRNQWILLALASGACAAFNGVFAKLTTTELTTSFSQRIASFLHVSAAEGAVEVVVRCTFFGLNLVFNGVMWTLFTTALARGNSTTQVSIMNTSSNFVITAVLGLAIFSESLPPLWWLGAALLVAGNVIIGRKDETSVPAGDSIPAGTAIPAGLVDGDAGGGGAAGPSEGLSEGDVSDGLDGFEQISSSPSVVVLPPEKDEEEDVLDLGDVEDVDAVENI